MHRRELLKIIATFTGAAVVGGDLFLSGCVQATGNNPGFSENTLALLNEVGETILPTTDTPGAKAANVAEVMKTVVTDCYPPDHQEAFMAGIDQLQHACKEKFSMKFEKCTPEQRHSLLVALEEEAKEFNNKQRETDAPRREAMKKEDREYDFVQSPRHYYTMMKQLTLLGYFSSEVGATQALRYLPIPGRYDGAFPYKSGDKAFA